MSQHTRAAISTLVLFGIVGLTYRTFQHREQLRFHKDSKRPGQATMDALRNALPFSGSPWMLAVPLTAIWTWRATQAINRLLHVRYNDAVYQLTRPDVLRNKMIAWKHLGSGLFFVPVFALAFALYRQSEISGFLHGASEVADGTLHVGLRDWGRNFQGIREGEEVRQGVREFLKTLRSDVV